MSMNKKKNIECSDLERIIDKLNNDFKIFTKIQENNLLFGSAFLYQKYKLNNILNPFAGNKKILIGRVASLPEMHQVWAGLE